MIYTVKGFGIVNKAEADIFLEFSCFFYDPTDVGNLISDSCSSWCMIAFIPHASKVAQNSPSEASTVCELIISRCSSWIHKGRGTKDQISIYILFSCIGIDSRSKKSEKNAALCSFCTFEDCVEIYIKLQKTHQHHFLCFLKMQHLWYTKTLNPIKLSISFFFQVVNVPNTLFWFRKSFPYWILKLSLRT